MPAKRLTLLLLFCTFCLGGLAQKGSLEGVLKDSSTKQTLSLASVTVFTAKDTTVITYRLSDDRGAFHITGLPLNLLCRVVITFQGYGVYRREFSLSKETPHVNLDTVYLSENAKALDEVLITAERPPVSMRNDTLEFNASAFKTLPSALVEDLLKKLPGMDVDLDGNITVRGRKVNRLLVDGREFFGGDARIATRNLPANIVDKIQVTDDKEEKRRNPLLRADEIGQVLNIKLKKAIKQGWFGKAYAGGGTDSRHEAGAIVNLFRDTAQISIIGHSNNVNKPGFGTEDLQNIGGFNRGGEASFRSDQRGIQHSLGGGFNFNNQWAKNLSVNLRYFYKEDRSLNENTSTTRTFLEDTVLTIASTGIYKNVGKNHQIGATLQWQIDSSTQLRFSPGITPGKRNSVSTNNSLTADNFKGPVNGTMNSGFTDETNHQFNGSLSFSSYSRKREGRSFNADISTSGYGNDDDAYEDGRYRFYRTGADSVLNRLHRTTTAATHYAIDLTYNASLLKNASVSLVHRAQYVNEKSSKNIFDKDPAGKYALYLDTFSTGSGKRGWENTTTANVSFRAGQWAVSPGINFFWLNHQNTFRRQPGVRQDYFYVYPSFSVNFKSLTLSYNVNISAPDARELQEVIDVSNPLHKEYGNPGLKPVYNRNLGLYYYKYLPKSGSSFHLSLNAGFENNSTVNQTLLDSNRVEISRPVNVNGARNLWADVSYNHQYKLSTNFHLSLRPDVNIGYQKSYVFVNGNLSQAVYTQARFRLNAGFNYHDLIECNQRYSLDLNGSRYGDTKAYRDADLVTHNTQWEVVLRWPRHVVWENTLAYNYNPRISAGIRKSTLRINSGINYLFLKEDKGQIKLSVYDLLNQNVSVYRYAEENSIIDGQATTLRRYLLLSFIYNIRTFGSGRKRPTVMRVDDDE